MTKKTNAAVDTLDEAETATRDDSKIAQPDPEQVKITPLLPKRFKQAEYQRNIFEAVPPAGTKYEDVLKPEYWVHVAYMLKIRDRIEVIADDFSYFAELIVTGSGQLWVNVEELRFTKLGGYKVEDDAAHAGYEVKFSGVVDKWVVLRGTDVMHRGSDTEKQARSWMNNHVRQTGAGKTRIGEATL